MKGLLDVLIPESVERPGPPGMVDRVGMGPVGIMMILLVLKVVRVV